MKHSISIAIAILALCILHRADAIATNKTTAADKVYISAFLNNSLSRCIYDNPLF